MMRYRLFCFFMVLLLCVAGSTASAQSPLNETVEATFLGLNELFKDNFNSSQALGKPVEAGDFVFIPVVIKGAGFGFGSKLKADDKENRKDQNGQFDNKHEDRIGLGGGAFVRPIALIVVKKGGDFQLIKLNEGFMSQLAKSMAPAMCNVIKDSVKNLFKMAKKAKKAKEKKVRKEKRIIEKKLREMPPQGPGPMMGPGPRGPFWRQPGKVRP